MTEKRTSIYVIGSVGRPMKVGLASDPRRRLRALQTGSSEPLAVLHAREVPREIASNVERRAHWLLRDHAVHREWFSASASEAMDAVNRAVDDQGVGEKASSSVGRPPLKRGMKVKQAAVWLHEDLLDRIKQAAGKQGFSEFMREAALAELKRRERAKPPKPDQP